MNSYQGLDKTCFVFWKDSTPCFQFEYTNKITFRGNEILKARQDINVNDLWFYIKAYYRVIPHNILYKRILTVDENIIKNLTVKDLRANVDDKDLVENMKCSNNQRTCTIPFTYKKENEAFGNLNSCKYLAYLVIAETTSEYIMPIELISAKIFFKKYFENESYREVFDKCCKFNECDPEETLSSCKKSLKKYYQIYMK